MTDSGRKLRAIDLCCGAGGWAFAGRGLPIEFVAVVDVAADCLEAWRVNHASDHPDCRLIRHDLALGLPELPACDLLLGGIPCEQVSIMRQSPASAETMDAWYALLDACLGAVALLQPAAWCFEDVIQIERHLPLPLLHGAHIPCRRIDSSLYGPQRRIRSFLGDYRIAPPPDNPGVLADVLRPGPHLTIAGQEEFERLRYPGRQITLLSAVKQCRVLSPDAAGPTVLGGGPHRGQRQRRNWTVEDSRGRLRILSLQEFAALQGFPDDALFPCAAGRAQELVGQAIPIYVGQAILAATTAELLPTGSSPLSPEAAR